MTQPSKTSNPAQPLAAFKIGNRLVFELVLGRTLAYPTGRAGKNHEY